MIWKCSSQRSACLCNCREKTHASVPHPHPTPELTASLTFQPPWRDGETRHKDHVRPGVFPSTPSWELCGFTLICWHNFPASCWVPGPGLVLNLWYLGTRVSFTPGEEQSRVCQPRSLTPRGGSSVMMSEMFNICGGLFQEKRLRKSANNKCCRVCGEKGTLVYCWWECTLIQPRGRTVRRSLIKLKIELPYAPAILLLGMNSEKIITWRDTCTPMFIAALFTISKKWQQPVCPPAEEWIRKVWRIYSGILLRDKKNEIMPFVATRMGLGIVIWSEVSQRKANHTILLIPGILKNDTNKLMYKIETDSQT